jgi:hypothetical protein
MGNFTTGGIANTGDGHIENSWVWTSATPSGQAVYANPGTGARVINSYYPDANSTFTGSTGTIEITQRPVEDFVNGSVAYDLNRYYLEARYRLFGTVNEGTSNYLFYEKADFSRLSRYIACKAIYHSRTLEEAIEAVKQLKTASPFSINILDTNIQRAVNIEKDLDTCYITEITGKFSRSNHFLNREAKSSVSSDYRLNKTRELLAQKEITRLKDVMDILDTIGTDEDHTVHIPASIETHGMTVINLAVDSSQKAITIRNFLDNSLTQFRL